VLHHPAAPQHLHRSATASATPAARESGCSPAQGAFSFTAAGHTAPPAGRSVLHPPAVFSSPRRPSSPPPAGRLLHPPLADPAGCSSPCRTPCPALPAAWSSPTGCLVHSGRVAPRARGTRSGHLLHLSALSRPDSGEWRPDCSCLHGLVMIVYT
jgi:hypothetical protein